MTAAKNTKERTTIWPTTMNLNTENVPPHRPLADIVAAFGLSLTTSPRSKKGSAIPVAGAGVNAANHGIIPESSRNNTLTSMAGSLRRKGADADAIDAALQIMNKALCKPPLDCEEVTAIAKSVGAYPSWSAASTAIPQTDMGNAERFANRLHDWARYVPEKQRWILWSGSRWQFDGAGLIMEMSKGLVETIFTEASTMADDTARFAMTKHWNKSQNVSRLTAMVDLAKTDRRLVARISELDTDDWLLGVANGVLDLRNGKLLAPKVSRLMTRQIAVEFDRKAKCPVFEAFLERIMGGNKSMTAYLRRVVGYSLTGRTSEQCLFFLYGKGANGKSTFLNVLSGLMGSDYAAQTPPETLMVKRNAGISNDIARLNNMRIVLSNEIEDCSLMAESLVKSLTGGDLITARFLYGENFEFKPKFKLYIAGNHKPIIRGRDNGIWRRIHLILFGVTIPRDEQDPFLDERLIAELPGILNWALKGCREWQKKGLIPPALVVDAVKEYRSEMDVVSQWIDDECTVAPGAEWQASLAYRAYRSWCDESGYKPMSLASFGRDLVERFPRVSRKDANYYLGIHRRGWPPTP